MSRVAVAIDDLDVVRRVTDALHTIGIDPTSAIDAVLGREVDEAAAALSASGCDVLVIGLEIFQALCVGEAIEREHPELTTVLVTTPDPEVWELAMRAGFRHVLDPAAGPGVVAGTLRRAMETADRRRDNVVVDLRERLVDSPTPPKPRARVITVLSPKGGAGKTTVSTNLAAGLACSARDRVALVDLDLQFGDVATAYRVDPTMHLGQLAPSAATDPAAVKLLLTHHESGVFVLCAPDDPAVGEEVPGEVVYGALATLADSFEYVVVDTSAGIDTNCLAAIEASTDLLLVGAMDVPSIRALRKLLDALDQLHLTGPARHVVLNRADSKVGIDAADVAAVLELPVSVSLPSSRSVPMSTNQGSPVLLTDPRSPVARPLRELVELFQGRPAAAAHGRAWLRRNPR